MPTEDARKDLKPAAESPAAAAAQLLDEGLPPWLAGVSEFVKKYQNVLYAIATVVLLTWAILTFQSKRKNEQMNSAEWELKQAESVEALRGVLDKYQGLAIEPRIRLRIADKLMQDNKIDDAIKEFETVKSKWPESLPGKLAAARLGTAKENKDWDGKGGTLEKKLEELRKMNPEETPTVTLPTAVKIDDAAPPQVELTTSAGPVVIELDEDAAPNATAAFVRSVETQYYDKTAVYKVEKDVAVFMGDILPTGDSPRSWSIPFESSKLPDISGAVALVRDLPAEGKEDSDALRNTGAFRFVIFTGDAPPQYKGKFLIVGRVTKGIETVRKLATTDKIVLAKMLNKKGHPYSPKTVEAPKDPPKPEEPPKDPPK